MAWLNYLYQLEMCIPIFRTQEFSLIKVYNYVFKQRMRLTPIYSKSDQELSWKEIEKGSY